MFNTDPNRPIDDILTEIRSGASQGISHPSGGAAFILPPLAALLVRLSNEAKERARDAADTADKTLAFTKYLFWATIILLIVTILLVGLEFMKLKEPSHGDSKPDQTQEKNTREISRLPPPTAQQQKGIDFIEKYKTGLSPPVSPLPN